MTNERDIIKVNRDILDIVTDMEIIIKEYKKMVLIKELIGIKH